MKKFLSSFLVAITILFCNPALFSEQSAINLDFMDNDITLESIDAYDSQNFQKGVADLVAHGSRLRTLFIDEAEKQLVTAIKREVLFKIGRTCKIKDLLYLAQFLTYNGDLLLKTLYVVRDVVYDLSDTIKDTDSLLDRKNMVTFFQTAERFIKNTIGTFSFSFALGYIAPGSLDEASLKPTSGATVLQQIMLEVNDLAIALGKIKIPLFQPLIAPLKMMSSMAQMIPAQMELFNKIPKYIEKYFTPKECGSLIDLFNSNAYKTLKDNVYTFINLHCLLSTKPAVSAKFQKEAIEVLADIMYSAIELGKCIALTKSSA